MNYVLVFCKHGKEKDVAQHYTELGYGVELPIITKLVRKSRRSRQRVLRSFVAIKGTLFLSSSALDCGRPKTAHLLAAGCSGVGNPSNPTNSQPTTTYPHLARRTAPPQYQKGFLTDHLGTISLISQSEVEIFAEQVATLSDTTKEGDIKGGLLVWTRGEACLIHHPAFKGETGVVTHIKDRHAKIDITDRDLPFGVTISLDLISKPRDKRPC